MAVQNFTGEADGGTFRYFVVHGDGSSITPVRNDWYLVRGDEITPPETTPPPPTNPNPTPPTPPEFTPGDDLPLPPEPPPTRLSGIADLTPAANAAIGTFSATMPLFYADMDTLVERLVNCGYKRKLQLLQQLSLQGYLKKGGRKL
jgi:hypothetical protein